LRFKRADALLAGGIEELAEESHLGFEKNGFLSKKGFAAPFSANRDGTVLGEGSALLVLETATQAFGRGRESLAEIAGFGSRFGNRFGYETTGEAASAAIREALENSGLSVERIGGIISSGSGSVAGDEMEVHALRNVFGSRLPEIPVYAPKLILGETLGASGALAAVIAVLALKNGKLPPSPGMDSAFKDLRLSSNSEEVKENALLINGFNCDGNYASLIIQRPS
jgi:3-oxoacyl-(acyl-carrier-protein) synthase